MVTEYNHRGAERTEDERAEDYDYLRESLLKIFERICKEPENRAVAKLRR
jgi:predicted  nucleic acid-binding Zn-ribbon protein